MEEMTLNCAVSLRLKAGNISLWAMCKKYNYLGYNGVIGKKDVLRSRVWCYPNYYNYYAVYTYYLLNELIWEQLNIYNN